MSALELSGWFWGAKFGKFVISSGASHDHACALERAADPLYSAGVDAEPRRDLAHTLGAPRLVEGCTDALFQLRGDRRPAEALAFAPGSRKACADPFPPALSGEQLT